MKTRTLLSDFAESKRQQATIAAILPISCFRRFGFIFFFVCFERFEEFEGYMTHNSFFYLFTTFISSSAVTIVCSPVAMFFSVTLHMGMSTSTSAKVQPKE